MVALAVVETAATRMKLMPRPAGVPPGAVEVTGRLLLAPMLGLLFVIFLPVVGFGSLCWYASQAVRDGLRPAAV